MKVLHILAQLPKRTGSGVNFSNIVKGLERRGVENALIYGTEDPYEIDFDLESYPLVFKTEEVPFPIVGMSDEMPYDATRYGDMTETMIDKWTQAFKKRLVKARDTFKPDLVLCHHLWMLTSLALDVFEDSPCKMVGVSHGTDMRQAMKNNQLRYKYVRRLNRLDYVFALSDKEKAQAQEIFGIDEEKIQVVGGAFDEDIFNDKRRPKMDERVRIVYAGKLARAKGVFELAKAFPNLKRKYPQVRMYLIGSCSQEEKNTLYENAHFMPGFRIFDVVNQKKLGQVMKRCDIFCLASYYEGLGLTAIEALACKMRVVASRIDGLMGLLGPEVNESGVIDYVSLPRLYDTDKPVKADIDPYVERLEESLAKQIESVIRGEDFPEDIYDQVFSHSWDRLVEGEYQAMKRLLED